MPIRLREAQPQLSTSRKQFARHIYSAYGISISSDVSVPGFLETPSNNEIDLRLFQGKPAHLDFGSPLEIWQSPVPNSQSPPNLRIRTLDAGAYFWFHYHDGTDFVINEAGTEAWLSWPESLPFTEILPWLRGPLMGFVLRLRGATALHASAISIDNRAIALMGPPEAGKSTTAAAFARLGYPVLSDDVVPLSEQHGEFHIAPGYPNVCLWPSAVAMLFGSEDALPRITPDWEKRYLDLDQHGLEFQKSPVPLAAIYELAARSDAPHAPYCEAVNPRDALVAMLGNTYASYLPNPNMRVRDFEQLARVAVRVPMRRVVPSSDPQNVTGLCQEILRDFAGLGVSAARV